MAEAGNDKKECGYTRDFDLIIVQKAWIEKSKERKWAKKLDRGYCWELKTAERVHKKGRSKGGIMVGIKKGIKFEKIEEWK